MCVSVSLAAGALAQEDRTVCHYDLSYLLDNQQGSDDGYLSMIPINDRVKDIYRGEDLGPLIEGDGLVMLIQESVCRETWENEENSLHFQNADRKILIVKAPQQVQERIATFIDLLGSAFICTKRLDIRVMTGEALPKGKTLLDRDEADRIVDALVKEEKIQIKRSASTSLSDLGVMRIESVDEETFLGDWHPEVAKASVISEPESSVHEFGLKSLVRAYHAAGGDTCLDIMIRYTETVAPHSIRILNGLSKVGGSDPEPEIIVDPPNPPPFRVRPTPPPARRPITPSSPPVVPRIQKSIATYTDGGQEETQPGDGPSAGDEPEEGRPAENKVERQQGTLTSFEKSSGFTENPEIGFTSFAGSLVIPEGKVLWIPSILKSKSGKTRCLFELRVTGQAEPLATTLSLEELYHSPDYSYPDGRNAGDDSYCVEVIPSGFATGRGVNAPDIAPSLFERDGVWEEEESYCGSSFRPISEHEMTEGDEATFLFPGHDCDEEGISQLFLYFHHLWLVPQKILDQSRPRIELLNSPGEALEVSGKIYGKGRRLLGEFRIPLLTGKSATLWAGVEGSQLPHWDVDVADQSAVGNPAIVPLFDCYALRFRAKQVMGTRYRLDIRGKINLLDGEKVAQGTGIPYTPFVEKNRWQTLYLDDNRIFDIGAKSVRLFFGGHSNLSIELEIARL